MPAYEYECPSCGTFEVEQRMADPALTHHDCGAPVVRTIPRVAFSLKGGGWSADGYASPKPKGSEGDGAACSPGGCAKLGCPARAASSS